jgi:hypothetical protein
VQPYSINYKIDLIRPPSARIEAPFVAELSGLEKQTIVSAISSTEAKR